MEDVVVTGIGVVSPLGNSVEELTRRVAAGERAAAGSDGCSIPVIDIPMDAIPADKRVRLGRLDRLCRFFLSAAYLAVADAALVILPEEAERVGLSFGTGLGCLLTDEEYNRKVVEQGPAAASPRLFAYTVSSAAAGEVSIALGIKGPNVTAHMGFAAGLGAVGYGFDLIQMGKADVVLAGGADVIGPALIAGLHDMGVLRAGDAISGAGIRPSEGAVVVVLERRDHARRRGARCWGRIDGYAAGFEPTLTRRARVCTGVSATLNRALALSGRTPNEIGFVVSGAHGTRVDDTERAALAEVLGAESTAVVLTPKAALGESFGASGVLGLALAAGMLDQQNTATVVLINALCYSGDIVSLLFTREGAS
ncbi:MAG TPA: beta-ketoacyl synthase N-terminal-like domain-containing protein [Candidatus Acidoferrales bacterium]|nr:beta-ketoacyl synthase N-terminal-like domain-containing protein [Candidatus Acidoferrales bacterium]